MATDIEYTAAKAAGGAVRGGTLGGLGGFFGGLGLGMIGGLANPAGIVLGIAGILIGTIGNFTGAVPLALTVGLAMPAIGGIMGAASGLALGTGAGAGLGGVMGAMSGAERSAERTAQYELLKEKFKRARRNEIDPEQAISQVGTQLYLQGRAEQAYLDQQAMEQERLQMAQNMKRNVTNAVAAEHENVHEAQKTFVGRLGVEPRSHRKIVEDTIAAANTPQGPGPQ